MMSDDHKRDIVVVGASAGGLNAVGALLEGLPEQLDAVVFVVQHQARRTARGKLGLYYQRSRLPVSWAENGQPAERGHVYVAPPDYHLVLWEDDNMVVVRGPRENRTRPAIDPLFRTAAAFRGSRTIAILLTGLM